MTDVLLKWINAYIYFKLITLTTNKVVDYNLLKRSSEAIKAGTSSINELSKLVSNSQKSGMSITIYFTPLKKLFLYLKDKNINLTTLN